MAWVPSEAMTPSEGGPEAQGGGKRVGWPWDAPPVGGDSRTGACSGLRVGAAMCTHPCQAFLGDGRAHVSPSWFPGCLATGHPGRGCHFQDVIFRGHHRQNPLPSQSSPAE
jgi:hypothetical protein